MHKLIASLARVTFVGGAILLATTIFVMPRIATMRVHAGSMCPTGVCGQQTGNVCVYNAAYCGDCYCGVCDDTGSSHNLTCVGDISPID